MSLIKQLQCVRSFNVRIVSFNNYFDFKKLVLNADHTNHLELWASFKIGDGWLNITHDEKGVCIEVVNHPLSKCPINFKGKAFLLHGENAKRFAMYKVGDYVVEFQKDLVTLECLLKLEPDFESVKKKGYTRAAHTHRM